LSDIQFIRNILIFGEKVELQLDLVKELKALSNKVNVEIIKDKSLVSQNIAIKSINAVFINSINSSDCLYIIRLLKMYKVKTNPKLNVFFTSESFETFQRVIEKNELKELSVLPWPVNSGDVANKIIDSIYDKKLSKQVVTKNDSVLNIDLEFIQVFINATKSVLTEMGQVQDIAHHKPVFKDTMSDVIEAGISSKIMISSTFFTGNFYVIFPEASFLSLYESAVYEHCESINDENRDFAGELANIIYGQSKKVLSASGLNLDMAIPSIHNSTEIDAEIVIVIPFDSSIGNFYIAVAPGAI
jgi:CheY-specific phosphatase CheX